MKCIMPSRVDGELDAPPSKSTMQRVLIAAALINAETKILNPSFCDDAKATIEVIKALGANVSVSSDVIRVIGGQQPKKRILDCGESGTCMRMISPVAARYEKELTVTGTGSLMQRPMNMIKAPLKELGAECSMKNETPPIKIKGPIHGAKMMMDGSATSQFLSGLLMALPLCKEDSCIEVANLKSKPYIRLTESVLLEFGIKIKSSENFERFEIKGGQKYKPAHYHVDGDWSGAAFMLVAGAIAGSVKVKNLKSLQPDHQIISIIEQTGAKIRYENDMLTVTCEELNGFECDASHSPDLFPPLAVLACNCRGKSTIYGAERLRHKESNRADALVKELGKLGAHIRMVGNAMRITGRKLKGGIIDSHNDHRIAMAGAIAALASEGKVGIENEGCVSKSYPAFFEDLEKIMVRR